VVVAEQRLEIGEGPHGLPAHFRHEIERAQTCAIRRRIGPRDADDRGGAARLDADLAHAIDDLERLHRLKTGALIRAAILLGASCGRALSDGEQAALDAFAQAAGLAFQVVDDILDVEGSTASLGKSAGKDAQQNKPTYVSVLGLEAARRHAGELRDQAHAALVGFGSDARRLEELADLLVRRTH